MSGGPPQCITPEKTAVEDQEFKAENYLLSMLVKAQIYNRAVFVVRYYGGTHLGPEQFKVIVEASLPVPKGRDQEVPGGQG